MRHRSGNERGSDTNGPGSDTDRAPRSDPDNGPASYTDGRRCNTDNAPCRYTEPRPQGSGPALTPLPTPGFSRFATLAIAALFTSLLHAQTAAHVDFQREIRPILSENCFQCHGPDSASRQAGLRLDRREAVLGKVIVPGNSAASLLYQRITDPDPNARMPLAESRRSLTPAQIALIKRWIDQGAPWQEQWAFQPPVKAKPPVVTNPAWAQNPIDRFILASLEAKGLAPAPAADARTLIRRVAL